MKLRDKIYAVKVGAELVNLVKDINGKPSPIDYMCYNMLKDRVAKEIFTENRPVEIYNKLFVEKSLEDYCVESAWLLSSTML